MFLSALFLPGCDVDRAARVWSPAETVARTAGQATATALDVRQRAVRSAEGAASVAPGRCRAPWPEGAFTVHTTVRTTTKSINAPPSELLDTHTWRRDLAGNVARTRTVRSALHDGREVVRTRETRVLGGRSFVAIDGIFGETSREPAVARAVREAAGADVDLLGSLVSARGGHLEPATRDATPLCPRPAEAPELPAIRGGSWVAADDERSGWLRWEDRAGRRMIVTFTERVSAGAEPVEMPEDLRALDADRSFAQTTSWLERGAAEGWFSPAEPEGP